MWESFYSFFVCGEEENNFNLFVVFFGEDASFIYLYFVASGVFFFLIKKIATPLKPYFNATLYTFISSITILTTTILLPLDIDTFEK